MNPVQALAILSLGAFVTVLITAVFYVFTVRGRLLSPEVISAPSAKDEKLHTELVEQRLLIEKLGTTLSRHTAELSAARTGTGMGAFGPGLDNMRSVLDTQLVAVRKIGSMLMQQTEQLTAIDTRIQQQEQRLERLEAQLTTSDDQPESDRERLVGLLEAQADRLAALGTRVEKWNSTQQDQAASIAHYAVVLDELKRELNVQAALAQELDTRVNEQRPMLESVAESGRTQRSLMEDLKTVFSEMLPKLDVLADVQIPPEQNRLTEIEGIGPVYSGKLYDAGITTFRQLAEMTPADLNTLIGAPEWRARSIDTESWIKQAKHLAAQREKVETDS